VILPINFSPWFITVRTLSTENRKVYIYTRSNDNVIVYPSFSECAKALKISRTTKLSLGSGAERTLGIARRSRASQAQPPIRRVIKEAQPESNFM
jgi:metallophosphoesterase superfamily enzyme